MRRESPLCQETYSKRDESEEKELETTKLVYNFKFGPPQDHQILPK